MTHKEIINRNIGLTFDFLRQIVNDPSILDKIPDGTTLEFVEKDFSVTVKNKRSKSKAKRKFLRVKSELYLI
ncbi:MAG: hypothetical protein ABIT08_13560 [Bacteroidia bacterium]